MRLRHTSLSLFATLSSWCIAVAQEWQHDAREREMTHDQLRVVIEVEQTYAAGGLDAMFGYDRKATQPPASPSLGQSKKYQSELTLSGDRVRVREDGWIWNVTDRQLYKNLIHLTNDGKEHRFSTQRDPDDIKIGYGVIQYPNTKTHLMTQMLPIFLHCRSAESRLTDLHLGDCRPTGREETIDGTKCKEYELTRGRTRYRAWLCPTKRNVCLKFESYVREAIEKRTRIDYVAHGTDGAVRPDRWTTTTYSKSGTVAATSVCKVVEYRIDDSLAKDDFRLKFHAGLSVNDQTKNQWLKANTDGTFTLTDHEGHVIKSTTSGKTVLVVTLTFTAVAILVAFAIRRKKSAQALEEKPR
jgi:hypothetical protein